MSASSGWICCENTSLVSQVGWVDGSHAEHACACRRREGSLATRPKRTPQDFFALWKDADPDIPILKQAKAEYEKVK
jgi:hypothetical protein